MVRLILAITTAVVLNAQRAEDKDLKPTEEALKQLKERLPKPVKKPFSFGALGDQWYGNTAEKNQSWEALQKSINDAKDLDFVVHVGDFRTGWTNKEINDEKHPEDPCSDALYQKRFASFSKFNKPLIYTPGDNDWRDCGGRSEEISSFLNKLRSIFFDKQPALGKAEENLKLVRQSELEQRPKEPSDLTAHPKDFRRYSENAIWTKGSMVFASVHMIDHLYPCNCHDNGTSQCLNLKDEDTNECVQRVHAARKWMLTAAEFAKRDKWTGLVVVSQLDLWLNPDRNPGECGTLDGIAETLRKPVLYIYGDTHKYTWLEPQPKPTGNSEHYCGKNYFTLQVPGDPSSAWVRVNVDPKNQMKPVEIIQPFRRPFP